MSDWIQNNWYQLGSFFVQFAFLFAAIWFARRVLMTMRASQEQVGALLKLSVTGTAPDRQLEPSPVPVARAASEASPYWLPPTPSQPEPRSEERRVGKECRSRWSPS